MRGLPQPDFQLSFLRADQVAGRLDRLEDEDAAVQHPDEVGANDEDEDEDGVEPDGVRGLSGQRQLVDQFNEDEHFLEEVLDEDEAELSEYEDRRRLRADEIQHRQRLRRNGIIRTSIRLEQLAYQKTVPHAGRGAHGEIAETLQRYDQRLAAVDSEVSHHDRLATALRDRCESSLRQARLRRQEREQAARAMARQQRQWERRQKRELRRQQLEAEEARAIKRELDRRRQLEVDEARAIRRELDRRRREKQWLLDVRGRDPQRMPRRTILGELNTADYPDVQGG